MQETSVRSFAIYYWITVYISMCDNFYTIISRLHVIGHWRDK